VPASSAECIPEIAALGTVNESDSSCVFTSRQEVVDRLTIYCIALYKWRCQTLEEPLWPSASFSLSSTYWNSLLLLDVTHSFSFFPLVSFSSCWVAYRLNSGIEEYTEPPTPLERTCSNPSVAHVPYAMKGLEIAARGRASAC
jgi:CRISPR-associated DxTHG motif protein